MKTQRLISSTIGCLVLVLSTAAIYAADEVEKGTPEAPPSAKAVAGAYYLGDLGFNFSLKLKENGTYTAECACHLGKFGEASGTWSLKDKRITLTPSKEEDMMKGRLRSLDVLKFKGEWIFVPTEKFYRDLYDKFGVSRLTCFQKHEKIK